METYLVTLIKKKDDGRIISKESTIRVITRRIQKGWTSIEDSRPKTLLYGPPFNGLEHWASSSYRIGINWACIQGKYFGLLGLYLGKVI